MSAHIAVGSLDRSVGAKNSANHIMRKNSGQQHIKHPNPFAPTQNKPPTAGFVELVDEKMKKKPSNKLTAWKATKMAAKLKKNPEEVLKKVQSKFEPKLQPRTGAMSVWVLNSIVTIMVIGGKGIDPTGQWIQVKNLEQKSPFAMLLQN